MHLPHQSKLHRRQTLLKPMRRIQRRDKIRLGQRPRRHVDARGHCRLRLRQLLNHTPTLEHVYDNFSDHDRSSRAGRPDGLGAGRRRVHLGRVS
ncbi:hypothetical protein GCM10027614_74800 [Micromonospora vulcania]